MARRRVPPRLMAPATAAAGASPAAGAAAGAAAGVPQAARTEAVATDVPKSVAKRMKSRRLIFPRLRLLWASSTAGWILSCVRFDMGQVLLSEAFVESDEDRSKYLKALKLDGVVHINQRAMNN